MELDPQHRLLPVSYTHLDVYKRQDVDRLSKELGIPVVPITARTGEGLDTLLHTAHRQMHLEMCIRDRHHLALGQAGSDLDVLLAAPPQLHRAELRLGQVGHSEAVLGERARSGHQHGAVAADGGHRDRCV